MIKVHTNTVQLKNLPKKLNKKFNKQLRDYEIKLANRYKELAVEYAPDGDGRDHGSTEYNKLKDILGRMKIRTDHKRSGIKIDIFGGRKGKSVKIETLTSDKTETQKVNWVNDGTGIYGPRSTPIRSKSGKKLKWEDATGTHYAWQVKGQKGQHFLEQAADTLKKEISSGSIKF